MLADTGYLYELFREMGLSDFAARTGEFLLVRPLKVLLLLLAAFVLTRLSARWIRRTIRSFQERAPMRAVSPRAEQRAITLGGVLTSLARAVIWAVAVLMIFAELGVSLAPLLAGAGIAGLAVGFGAQTLVRDVLSGVFILVEDEYGVGDVVTVGDRSGTVEAVDLRVTRLRAVDGTVWYIPNGDIRQVGNSSIEWGRAIVDVVVPRAIDVETALAEAADELRQFAADDQWSAVVLDEPEVWGVEATSAADVTLRLAVRTAPGDRVTVTRALRGRVAQRLQRADGSGAAA